MNVLFRNSNNQESGYYCILKYLKGTLSHYVIRRRVDRWKDEVPLLHGCPHWLGLSSQEFPLFYFHFFLKTLSTVLFFTV